ncbi:dTDP-4-dehydrorhamnose 3,5-epimerase [Candidatus Pelagibacter sp.]|jgi:dTDP-4-dehydrorhamnose 3,5-epimerase|nr:dTDP-4-dehydrorhamnose 3,5-epimerase [Candidatus Pelagibacter sp.]|tara:strand:- start:2996 stop:3529 length:534 start_codon:yes stop_codon:yes gene_type:complete
MLKIKKNKFKGLLFFDKELHKDQRGYLRELLVEKEIKKKFKFHIVSKSKKHVLRGLHFQYKKPQGKYISVVKGKIFDAVVDLRKNSKTFGKSYSIILSEKNCKSVYIPPGFAHGFQALEKENIVCYSCTQYRSIGNEYGLLYNDPSLKIKWPKKKKIITKKDKYARTLNQLIKEKTI